MLGPPQLVPLGKFAAVLPQTGAPEVQTIAPTLHGLGAGAHAMPASHATHAPVELHTPASQPVPGGRLVPELTQVSAPVLQEVTPTRQAVGLVLQPTPASQFAQIPPGLQTRLVPQLVPASLSRVVSTQSTTGKAAQDCAPKAQRLGLVVHPASATQVPQVPAPVQSWLVPQLTPASTPTVPSTQTAWPVAQLSTPRRQVVLFPVHASPASQGSQLPVGPHTAPGLQAVPASKAGAPFTHCEAPVAHEVTPGRQVSGLPEQLTPSTQTLQLPTPSQT